MLSARGSQREADRIASKTASGSFTPRETSTLKLAGLDVSNASRQAACPAKKKGVDTVPHIRSAGHWGEVSPWSCEPDIIVPTPRTPELDSMQKRHKKRTGPGEISIHWGMKETSIPEAGLGYGVASKKGEGTEANMKAGQKFGIAEYVQARGESIYETVKREPLGKPYNRGHVLPQETKDASFKGFGKAIVADQFDAKESLFPRYVDDDTDDIRAQYRKTHGDYDPGEAINRKYNWPDKVAKNPHFRFGSSDAKQGNLVSGDGAKTALTMDLEADRTFPRTRVVDRTSENFRQVNNDRLGSGRNMLQGKPPVPAGHAFGLESGSDSTHAGELMHGFYTAAEQKPDDDLGRSTVKGRRNFLTRQSFGVPSVRRDLEAPPHHKRSVASATNYGDDLSAFSLIYPPKYGFRGVEDDAFFFRRPREEMKSLLESSGYALDDQDFQILWDQALKAFADNEQLVSLSVMLNAVGHWLSAKGVKPGQRATKADETLLPSRLAEATCA